MWLSVRIEMAQVEQDKVQRVPAGFQSCAQLVDCSGTMNRSTYSEVPWSDLEKAGEMHALCRSHASMRKVVHGGNWIGVVATPPRSGDWWEPRGAKASLAFFRIVCCAISEHSCVSCHSVSSRVIALHRSSRALKRKWHQRLMIPEAWRSGPNECGLMKAVSAMCSMGHM